MTCGQKIKELRIQRNLSQKQLGEILHVSDKTISKWETGRTLPDIEMIQKIAQYFHISIDELISQRKGIKPKTKRLMITLVIVVIMLLIFILYSDMKNIDIIINAIFFDLLSLVFAIGISLYIDFHHRLLKIMKYICLSILILLNLLYMMTIFGNVGMFMKGDGFPLDLFLLSMITGILLGVDS